LAGKGKKNLQAKQLSVVHLKKHTSDLASKLRLLSLDLGVESLAEHLLLLGRGSGDKSRVAGGGLITAGLAGRSLTATLAAAHLRTTTAIAGTTTHTLAHGHTRNLTTATSTTTEGGDLHGVTHAVRHTRALHGHGHTLEVGRHLLVGTHAAAALLREGTGELTGTSGHTGHDHTSLGREGHTALTSGDEALLAGTVKDGGLHVRLRHTSGSGGLLLADGVAGLDASLELTAADILALSESDIEGLAVNHALVHLGHSLGGLIGAAEADEAEALALAEGLLLRLLGLLALLFLTILLLLLSLGLVLGLLGLLTLLLGLGLVLLVLLVSLGGGAALAHGVTHNLGRGDGAVGSEKVTQLVVINVVSQVLDVEVHTLVLGGLLHTGSLVLLAQLLLTLVLLLGTANIELLALDFLVIHLLHGGLRALVGRVVDETKATALALLVVAEGGGGDLTERLEHGAELIVGDLKLEVLDVDVGVVGLHLLELALAVLLGDVVTDEDLLVVKKHAINVLDSLVGGLGGLVVDETVALGVAELILGDLAAENVTEGSKGVVQSLVVNGIVKVLDEDVALASLAQSRVTLGPHDTARLALDQGVVQVLEGALTVGGVVVVDVSIAEGAAGDGVTADTDRSNLTDGREELVQHGLGHGGVELADIEGSRVGLVVGSSALAGGLGGGSRGRSTVGLGRTVGSGLSDRRVGSGFSRHSG